MRNINVFFSAVLLFCSKTEAAGCSIIGDDCPVGNVLTCTGLTSTTKICTPCSSGRFKNNGNKNACDACSDCSTGEILTCGGSSTSCAKCAKGKAKNNGDKNACTNCANGMFADVKGLTACKSCASCNDGEYADGCERAGPTAGTCKDCETCESGKVLTCDHTSTSCAKCGKGKAKNNGDKTACTDCPVNFYANDPGLTACKQCVNCPKGEVLTCGGSSTSCAKCAKGKAKNNGDTNACTDCTVNFYADVTGLTACKQCDNCPNGQVLTCGGTSRKCVECEKGKAKDNGDENACTACTENSFTNTTGQTKCKTHSKCSDKKMCSYPADSDTVEDDCPPGQWVDQSSGTKVCTACRNCPSGKKYQVCASDSDGEDW